MYFDMMYLLMDIFRWCVSQNDSSDVFMYLVISELAAVLRCSEPELCDISCNLETAHWLHRFTDCQHSCNQPVHFNQTWLQLMHHADTDQNICRAAGSIACLTEQLVTWCSYKCSSDAFFNGSSLSGMF